jgi:plastocyanin
LLVFRWSHRDVRHSLAVFGAMQVLSARLRLGRVAAVILLLAFADIGFYTVTGAAANFFAGVDWWALALPAVLATFCITGVVSALAVLGAPRKAAKANDLALNFAGSVLFIAVLVLAAGALARRAPPIPQGASQVALVSEDMSFSNTKLKLPGQRVAITLENHDLFWHTFTVDALHVDLRVPMRARQTVQFEAPAGTYSFYCAIPGHELLGMKGTLVVE